MSENSGGGGLSEVSPSPSPPAEGGGGEGASCPVSALSSALCRLRALGFSRRFGAGSSGSSGSSASAGSSDLGRRAESRRGRLTGAGTAAASDAGAGGALQTQVGG